jgi:hypothetical protein
MSQFVPKGWEVSETGMLCIMKIAPPMRKEQHYRVEPTAFAYLLICNSLGKHCQLRLANIHACGKLIS